MTTELFLRLAQPNDDGVSPFIDGTKEFTGEFSSLLTKNGVSWARGSAGLCKSYKILKISANGKCVFEWPPTDEEKASVETSFKDYCTANRITLGGSGTRFFKICGKQTIDRSRPIGNHIRALLKDKPCVVCGCTSNIEIDHKNDLYNDPRVNDVTTQTVDDFQPLCKHCNDQKRQVVKKMKETGKRYSALCIPSVAPFGIAFTRGDESFDTKSPTAMVGTYWYDPVDFMKKVRERLDPTYLSANRTNTP